MKKPSKKPFIIVTLILILLLLIAFVVSVIITAPSKNPDALWPEEGKVIATIDGKEYRYDPIYLYRLSRGYFSDNPEESIDTMIQYPSTYTFNGVLCGDTQGEAAICLELLYREGKQYSNYKGEDNLAKNYGYELRSDYEFLMTSDTNPHRTEIIKRQKEAFYGIANYYPLYTLQNRSYTKKFVYIDTVMRFPNDVEISGLTMDEYNELVQIEDGKKEIMKITGDSLMKKYNVQIVTENMK